MRTRILTCVLLGLGAFSATGSELKAGVARIALTPPRQMKASLGGYGDRMSKPATGVHDRVFAKALVLSDGSKRFALVTADVLAFPPGFKAALVNGLEAEGWRSGEIMLLPSHSHTSIDMTAINPANTLGIPQIGIFHKALYDFTLANLVKVITEAGSHLVPVSVGTGTAQLDGWNRNRRKENTTCDTDLTVTRIDTADGAPLAVLINWTAHPTFMDSEDMMFSGGWPGHAQRTVEALIGRGVTAMYFNGAEGDQSPTPRHDSGGSWERAERYGRELGIVVWRQWQTVVPKPSPAFSFHREAIALPERTWHRDFMKTGGAEYGMNEQLVQQVIERMAPVKTASVSLRLGELLIVGVPGEMAAGLGMGIKSRVREAVGVRHVVIGGLADEWVSYILSAREYEKGGYEASVSFYGASLGQVMVEGAVRGASRHRKLASTAP